MHLQCGRPGFDPWVGKIPWRRERLPTPVFWPRKFHGLYRVAKSRTRLSAFHFTFLVFCLYDFDLIRYIDVSLKQVA